MRPHALSLVAILGLAASAAYAVGGDASDQFLDAFLNFQRGEKAEASGNARGAVSAYNKAIDVLDSIAARWPDWNPAIVKHRREKATEAVTRLQSSAPSAPSSSGRAPVVEPELPESANHPSPLPGDFPPPPLSTTPSPRTSSKKSSSSGDPIQEIQERIERLQKDLDSTKTRLSKATEEKEDLAKKYEKAVKDTKDMAEKMEVVQKRADRAESALLDAEKSGTKNTSELSSLRKEAADAKKALRQLQIERDAEMLLNDQFSRRISASRNQLADTSNDLDAVRKESTERQHKLDQATKEKTDLEAKLSKTQEQLTKATTERDAAQKEGAAVPKKLADMQKQIDQVTKEKTTLEGNLAKVQEQLSKVTGERDDALAQLNKMKEAAKNVDKLLQENTQLMAKLQDAEKQISTFKAEGVEKDKKIADLTKEVTNVRGQLADAQKQSADYQAQMNDLRGQLETQAKELAGVKADAAAGVAERKKLAEENDLLRGIVLRQQKEQAHRDRVKKLVLEQLAKLEVHSKALIDQVELLGSPVVKLTDKERKLFKDPQLSISDSEITFTAGDTTASAAPTAPAPMPNVDTKPAAVVVETKPALPPETAPVVPPAKAAPTPEAKKVADKKSSTEPAKGEVKDTKLTLEMPMPDKLPDIAQGAPKARPDDLASAKPSTTITPAAKGSKSPLEGELPSKDAGTSAPAGGEPGVSTGLKPAVPSEVMGFAREAKDQFDRGNYREAEKIYDKALAKAPNNLYLLSNKGVVLFRQQKYKLAEEAFRKAIAVAPEDDFSHCTLGIVAYQQGKFDDAIQALTRALAINSKNPTAHNYLGITASQKGWQEAAQKELETATAIDPNYADAHFNLAVVFATQNPPNKDEARKHYKRAVELGAEPDSSLEQLLK